MRLNLTKEDLHTRGGILDELLEKLFDSALIVDEEGRIIHASTGSLVLRPYTREEIIGHLHTEFYPGSMFLDVIKSGRVRMGVVEVIEGRKCIANIFPVYDGERVIGALGTVLFRNLNSLKTIIANIQDEKDDKSGGMFNTLARVGTSYTFRDYIGHSKATLRLLDQCRKVAVTDRTVLLIGETGTGKEILASAIHSGRQSTAWQPFVKINCSAIPNELLESELFGHEKGAFTGAATLKKGKFELAAGGSILLDEIGDMDLRMQSKLLRVLEEREFERVGGTKMLPMTARVIASTNADLRARAADGSFRSDLYYRLSALEIHVPPLRERMEDIPLLVDHFILRDQLDIQMSPSALDALARHRWPGNIRELRNVVNRLDIMCGNKTIQAEDVQAVLAQVFPESEQTAAVAVPAQGGQERQRLLDALSQSGYNLTKAAKQLGICRATLYNRLNRYGISPRRTWEND